MPGALEIEGVIFSFKGNEAPRLDGVTAEVVGTCWESVGKTCIAAINAFWKEDLSVTLELMSIIKLLPTLGGIKEALTN
jgi:hypothetical protein